MTLEMEALVKNKTWEVVELTNGKKLVGCKWVFTIKYKSNGTTERYKSKVCSQRLHLDLWNRLSRDFCTYLRWTQ